MEARGFEHRTRTEKLEGARRKMETEDGVLRIIRGGKRHHHGIITATAAAEREKRGACASSGGGSR